MMPVGLDIGSWMQSAVGGSMLLAIPVALLAGLVSFFSPCVVPLLPGYLAYASGLGAAEVMEGNAHRRRMLAGASLFVLGIAVVYVITGAVVGSVGRLVVGYAPVIGRVLGVVIILLGLVFAGVLRIGQRDLRITRMPAVGVAAAPLLGAVFALGWTPCIGPTLGVVLNLALNEGTALRGVLLMFVFTLGLGVPFVLAGLAYTKMARAVGLLRRHQVWVLRIGGFFLVVVGLMLVTGVWDRLMAELRSFASAFVPVI
jgi:cytochrome c-type biogenesis protein